MMRVRVAVIGDLQMARGLKQLPDLFEVSV
jgi:hypothetical protein